MPDFSSGEQQLFKGIESSSGLNEGDILKAIQRLDAQIEQEEMTQTSEDLTVASNPNINPEIAARSARLAGTDITTGDQLKAAKPILKRMSKTLTDPNISADVREASLAQDRVDLDQVTLRSTMRNGQRGVEVTGRTEAERSAGDEPQNRFFPEPDKPERQRETEAFLQTLEPESTILGGAAGQQQLAEKKARNDFRKAEFQAGRGKQVTVKPGEQIFDVRSGEATPIGGVAAPVKPVKGPTTIEAALLQPDITSARKKELIDLKRALKGKGLTGSITLPDGTQISVGTGETDKPTPTFKTQIQKETFAAQKGFGELLVLKSKITPESFGVVSSMQKGLQEVFEFFVPGSTPEGLVEPIKTRDKLFRQSEEAFALRVKELTGVQFGEKEASRLKKSFPNAEDNYAEFNNKLDDLIDSYMRSIARLIRQGISFEDKIGSVDPRRLNDAINAVPLGAITDEEIEAVKLRFGISETQISEGGSIDLSRFKR